MKLENKDLIEEFYLKEKNKFPDLSLEDFKEVCFGPWRFLKAEMENGNLSEVRFKYFGTFQVYEGRVKHLLHNLNIRYSLNKIGKEDYLKRKAVLENYLNKKQNGQNNN